MADQLDHNKSNKQSVEHSQTGVDEKTDEPASMEHDVSSMARQNNTDNGSSEENISDNVLNEAAADKKQSTENIESQPKKIAKSAPSKPITLKTRIPFFGIINLVLILAITGSAVWYFLQYQEKNAAQLAKIASLETALNAHQQRLLNVEQNGPRHAQSVKSLDQKVEKRFRDIESVQLAQNKRLLSMSTTSREDWLLAEAEYLLKLANQRVLIEKSATGADALLVEADDILKGLDDPDLFPLRRAIANDLAALRLTKAVDVEGIYLALAALANTVDQLPIKPSREDFGRIDHVTNTDDSAVDHNGVDAQDTKIATELAKSDGQGTFYAPLLVSLNRLMANIKQYVNLRDHAQAPIPVLVPEIHQYVRQNLRLIIEKAQLALLREQQDIYRESLTQAKEWIEQYYPESDKSRNFIVQLEQLQTKQIQSNLPNITGSLELLHSYIEQLHDLKGVKAVNAEKGE